MNRRNFFGIIAGALAIQGCASSTVGKTLSSAFGSSFSGKAAAFDADYAEKLPYASIAVTLKNIPKALLVLAKTEENDLHWMSSDQSLLATRMGRLIRTAGLPQNILQTSFVDQDLIASGVSLTKLQSTKNRRIIDLSPGNRYGMVVESYYSVKQKEEVIHILRHEHATAHITEHCHVPALAWRFENHFWIDDQGMVWRSIQHIAPEMSSVEIELIKAYRVT